MAPRTPDPYARRAARRAKVGGDPLFVKNHGRGGINAQDYTRFIRWTPLNIFIFGLFLTLSYGGAIVAVWIFLSPGAAIPLIALAICIGAFSAVLRFIDRLKM